MGTDKSGDPRSSEIDFDLDQHSAGKGESVSEAGEDGEGGKRRGGGKDSLGDKMSMARVLRGDVIIHLGDVV
jgi:hypothetical protein